MFNFWVTAREMPLTPLPATTFRAPAVVPPMIETLLAGQRPDYGVLPSGWLPLDVDTFATQGCRGPFPC